MEQSSVMSQLDADWLVMPPLTWDSQSPTPDVSTEQTPLFEASEFEGDGTIVTSAAYSLKPAFTGRVASLTKLATLTAHAFEHREIAFAVIIGDSGLGKSRIVAELVARMRAQRPNLAVISGASDDGSSYGPIARALATHIGIPLGEDAATTRDKIQAAVAEVVTASKVPEVAHLLAHIMHAPFEDSPVVAPLLESPQRLEARVFMAVRRYVLAIAERQPVMFVIENLDQCGSETINLLQYLAAGLREQPVALIATASPGLFERHAAFGDGEVAPTRIELPALTPNESEELLRELCKQLPQVPARVVAHVRALLDSPRSIHELVRLLLESDVIVREGVMWRIEESKLAGLELPKTYADLVGERLRVMDPTERRVVEMAAVIGETSWLDAILSLERSGQRTDDPDGPTLAQIASSGDHGRIAVVAAIGKLIERGMLVEVTQSTISGERELQFSYPGLWQLIYKGLDEARRRNHHAIVARWLELHPEGKAPAAQEEVARHLALAGDAREAASRYRRAAEAAKEQYANERAIRLYDRALACVGDTDLAARLHIWHDLGSIYELIGDFEAALGAFERMLRLSWVAASKTKAAVAFNKMGRVWRRKGDLKLAVEYLERGLELFRGAGDGRGVAGSLDDIGKSLHMLGRLDEAHAKITEALVRRGKGGDKRAIATSLSRLGDVQKDRGQFEAAYNCHKEALDLRKQTGDRWGQIVSQNNLAALAFDLGDLAQARAGWLAALPDAEAIGALPLSALVLCNLGELALVEAKLEEARSRLDNALEIIEDIEDRGLETEVCRHLAALERAQGKPTAARELAERALAVARKAGLREKEAQAQLAIGDVLSTSIYDTTDEGGTNDAAVAYRCAVDLLRSIGNDAALARALFAYGRFAAEAGKLDDAKDMLRQAIAMFTRLGLGKPAESAKQLLATLS